MSQHTSPDYVVDFGGHIHPHRTAPEPLRQLNSFVGDRHTDVAKLVNWYSEAGIDAAVLSQPFFLGHDDPDTTAAANDALLEDIRPFSDVYGLAAIPTAAGTEAATDEFERCLDNGYHGGALETKSSGIELTDPEVQPVLEIANDREVSLLVHPKLDDSIHPDALDDRFRLNAIFGREIALCESISKVIHEGVLDRYPDLNLVYHHFGGNIASMLGRIHLQLDPGRWPGQDHVLDFESFKDHLTNRIYIDTSGFYGYSAPLRAALEVFPPSQILFGTDAPYEPRSVAEAQQFVSIVRDVSSSIAAERILSDNAVELIV